MDLSKACALLRQHAAAGRQIPCLVSVDIMADTVSSGYTDAATALENLEPESVMDPGEMPAIIRHLAAALFEIDAAGLAAWGSLRTPAGAIVLIPRAQA